MMVSEVYDQHVPVTCPEVLMWQLAFVLYLMQKRDL